MTHNRYVFRRMDWIQFLYHHGVVSVHEYSEYRVAIPYGLPMRPEHSPDKHPELFQAFKTKMKLLGEKV